MSLIIAACLCFASFGWGMVKHFERTGKATRAMMWTALLGLVSAILQITALAKRPHWLPGVALVSYVASAALFWWAVSVTRGKLAACGQGAVSPNLVTAGPYAAIRHPFYAAYNLTWMAGFLATGWWPLAVSAIAMAGIYERAAREEERGFLASPLARDYAMYLGQAGRYWPRLRTRPSQSGR